MAAKLLELVMPCDPVPQGSGWGCPELFQSGEVTPHSGFIIARFSGLHPSSEIALTVGEAATAWK
jgi:hypothetical protein